MVGGLRENPAQLLGKRDHSDLERIWIANFEPHVFHEHRLVSEDLLSYTLSIDSSGLRGKWCHLLTSQASVGRYGSGGGVGQFGVCRV